jgi:hypothetical protein
MDLLHRSVNELLAEQGVQHLHHANTVLTACQFLLAGSLLSRGTVERMGVRQTEQTSDAIDRRYSIWYDVFLDSVDIHKRASTANAYGPVLFVLDRAQVVTSGNGRVWVTRSNPTKWAGKDKSRRWFQSSEDLQAGFRPGNFDQMIVLRHCGGQLPLKGCLTEIILDDPELPAKDGSDLYSVAWGALKFAMTQAGLEVPITRRNCANRCRCVAGYTADKASTKARFLPFRYR